MTRSPTPAEGTLLATPWYPGTVMISISLAPVLSMTVSLEPFWRPLVWFPAIPFIHSTFSITT